jgi:hypothetical protein
MIAQSRGGKKAADEVPAEVSKRGVMIESEGALSSRRKRAAAILLNRPAGNQAKISRFQRTEERTRPGSISEEKVPAVFLIFFTAEKGENEVFHGLEVFSSRPKKTWAHYIGPGGKIKPRFPNAPGLA